MGPEGVNAKDCHQEFLFWGGFPSLLRYKNREVLFRDQVSFRIQLAETFSIT